MSNSLSVSPQRAPAAARRGWTRVFAFGLAAMLALILVAAAGHHHDRKIDAHACSVCAMLMDEVPAADGLPPVVAGTLVQSYVLLGAVVYVCWYRSALLLPPSCGPPACPSAT
jgi:hypothetical protein